MKKNVKCLNSLQLWRRNSWDLVLGDQSSADEREISLSAMSSHPDEMLERFFAEERSIGNGDAVIEGLARKFCTDITDQSKSFVRMDEPYFGADIAKSLARTRGGGISASGTLEGWRGVAQIARENHAALLAIVVAMTAPVVDILSREAPRVHLFGSTPADRSAIVALASSVFGVGQDGSRAIGIWSEEGANYEAYAHRRRGRPVVLTSREGCDPHDLNLHLSICGEAQLGLKNKSFSRVSAQQRSNAALVSCTANSLISHSGFDLDDHHVVVQLPIEVGIYFREGPTVKMGLEGRANEIERLAQENQGVAGLAFYLHLRDRFQKSACDLIDTLEADRGKYLYQAGSVGNDLSYEGVIKQRFATAFAAGSLACNAGILPWESTWLLGSLMESERDFVDSRYSDSGMDFW